MVKSGKLCRDIQLFIKFGNIANMLISWCNEERHTAKLPGVVACTWNRQLDATHGTDS